MALDASLPNPQHYKVWIKSKWRNSGKGVAISPTLWCSSYWKGAFRSPLIMVTQLTNIYIYIYTYTLTYMCLCFINNNDDNDNNDGKIFLKNSQYFISKSAYNDYLI